MKQQCCVLQELMVAQLSSLVVAVLPWVGMATTVYADGGTANRFSNPKNGVLSEAHMTFPRLDMQVGLTRLPDVRTQLGPSKMPRRTDGNDTVCYVSTHPDDRTLVFFGTHDFVGRDLLAVVNIMAEKSDFSKVALCGRSALISKDLMTKSGLALGLTKDQVKTILGPDAAITGLGPDAWTKGNYVAIDYERLIVAPFPPGKDEGKSHCYSLMTMAEIRFETERAVSVSLQMYEEGATRAGPICDGYE